MWYLNKIFYYSISSKLQEIDFIKVQGQQVTPKQFINTRQGSIYFSRKLHGTRIANYYTWIISI